MMRRGPLADYPIETLLAEAAEERINGVLSVRTGVNGQIYLVDGDIYLAEVDGQAPLDQRLVSAGLLTNTQIEEHGVPGAEGVYLARALDTDATIDEDAIDAYLLDLSAATVARFVGAGEGEFELDPYGAHPAGVMSSWHPRDVLARADELREEAAALEAERAEAERAEAERLEAARAEAERAEAERLEVARAEAERAEAERLEAERKEAEELEAQRVEAERLEAARVAAEQAESEQTESEQPETETVADDLDVDTPDSTSDGGDLVAELAPDPAGEVPAEDPHDHLPPPPAEADAVSAAEEPAVDEPGGARRSVLFDALEANTTTDDVEVDPDAPDVLVLVAEEPPEGTDSVELTTVEWRVVVRAAQGDSLAAISARLGITMDEARDVIDDLSQRGLLATIGSGMDIGS